MTKQRIDEFKLILLNNVWLLSRMRYFTGKIKRIRSLNYQL